MKTQKNNPNFWLEYGLPFLICFALTGAFLFVANPFRKTSGKPPLSIILSPHFDDAVLSLGGFMAENKNQTIVATFFTEEPPEKIEGTWDSISGFKDSGEAIETRTGENAKALARTGAKAVNLHYLDHQYRFDRTYASEEKLEQFLEKDIKAILETFSKSYTVSLYGPAEFGDNINHPDHKLLHTAFTRIAEEGGKLSNVSFFYYEDFPYIGNYAKSTTTPLERFLIAKNPLLKLEKQTLSLSTTSLQTKLRSIEDYTSQMLAFDTLGENLSKNSEYFTTHRCVSESSASSPCELVYKIIR